MEMKGENKLLRAPDPGGLTKGLSEDDWAWVRRPIGAVRSGCTRPRASRRRHGRVRPRLRSLGARRASPRARGAHDGWLLPGKAEVHSGQAVTRKSPAASTRRSEERWRSPARLARQHRQLHRVPRVRGACKQEFNLPWASAPPALVEEGACASGNPTGARHDVACNHCATRRASPPARWAGTGRTRRRANARACGPLQAWSERVRPGSCCTSRPWPRTRSTASTASAASGACRRARTARRSSDENAGSMDKCTGCFHRVPPQGRRSRRAAQAGVRRDLLRAGAVLRRHLATVDTWAQRAAGAPVDRLTSPPAGGGDIADPDLTNPSVRFTPLVGP